MAVRNATQNDRSEDEKTTGDLLEDKVVAFAGQLGFLVGTVQAKTEGWLDRKSLSKELGRIRDKAAALLEHVNSESPAARKTARKTASKRTATPAARAGRGPVDAPGKRHRKPPPQEPINPRLGEPEGKQMGRKAPKLGRRGVRR